MKNKRLKKFEGRMKKESWALIFILLFFIINLLVIIFFFKNIIITSCLLGFFSLIWFVYWKSPITIGIFIISALLGTFGEIIIINASSPWIYMVANIGYAVPFWLFILWGNAGMTLYRAAIELERLGVHKKW